MSADFDVSVGAFATFTRPCLTCGETVHVVETAEKGHVCTPVTDKAGAIAKAYWAGFDAGKAAS